MSVSRSRWWVGEWAELPVVEGGWGPHYIDRGKGEAARRTSMQVAKKADFDSKGCRNVRARKIVVVVARAVQEQDKGRKRDAAR
ncbi:hypothetical protein DPV78_003452 [Talaromyces pinophilus]|nr:hypothetical protein DPV78_003452 [Talaromyces pinophilus]